MLKFTFSLQSAIKEMWMRESAHRKFHSGLGTHMDTSKYILISSNNTNWWWLCFLLLLPFEGFSSYSLSFLAFVMDLLMLCFIYRSRQISSFSSSFFSSNIFSICILNNLWTWHFFWVNVTSFIDFKINFLHPNLKASQPQK